MSRHRDVRCMNYSEEYEGYDDVYGHSVEDDYCVSPSAEQFLFDRSKQQNIASFITEPDIMEDNEDSEEPPISSNEENVVLSELEKVKLMSCMESIKNVIGDTVAESEIRNKIIQSNFDAEVALDSVLKESSPRNDTEATTTDKDSSEESRPDATSIKINSSSFFIPKLSFNKEDNVAKAGENASLVDHLKDFKNLSIGRKLSCFPGLSINNVDTTLSNFTKESVENNTETIPFKSLADLTAHHLQKTNNIVGNTNTNEKTFSSSTNFVIPKLSLKKNCGSDSNNVHVESSSVQSNTNFGSDIATDERKDDSNSIDSLENSISKLLTFSRNCIDHDSKDNSENVESNEDSLLHVSGTRTPSPDPWVIDLSSALKEVTCLASNNCRHTKSKVLESVSNTISMSNLNIPNQSVESSYTILPTTLNLSPLRYAKLSHRKKNVSLFGRTLCKTWKLRKPILKCQKEHYDTVKRFDFSVPYSRA